MKKSYLMVATGFVYCAIASAQAVPPGSTLLYNGDSANLGGATNLATGNMIFDEFVVPAGGWEVTSLF